MSAGVAPHQPMRFFGLMLAGLVVLAVLLMCHLMQGSVGLSLGGVIEALLTDEPGVDQLVVRHLYLPRAAFALLAGAALAMAGVLLQTVTGNSLASPTTLGISSGAYLAAVVAAIFWPGLAAVSPLAVSFLGGAGAAALVYVIAGGVRVGPVRLVLAGVAVSMAFAATSSLLQIFYEQETAGLFFWGSGSLIQRDWSGVRYALPRLAVAGLVAVALARSLDVLKLGDDVARGLGQRVALVRSLAVLAAVGLAATTVAVTGPIGFVGLVAPHLAGLMGLRRHVLLLPASALLGGGVLLAADIGARAVQSSMGSVPTGVITALVGAPWLIWLARRAAAKGEPRLRTQDQGPMRRRPSMRRRAITLIVAAIVLPTTMTLGVALGDVRLTPTELLAVLRGSEGQFTQYLVWELRLPRVLVAAMAGMALAVSGALFQGVIRNPLAAPETVGVTGGAGLGAIAMLLLFPMVGPWLTPLGAFAGALSAFVAAYTLAYRGGLNPMRLALVGIAVAAFCMSGIQILVVQAEVQLSQALVWLAGSTYARGMSDLIPLAIALGLFVPLALFAARPLDLLALGDDAARGVGLPVERTRAGVLMLATALAATAVATVGTIGFLGLIAPHAARMLVGARHRWLIIMAALLGALILTLADLVGRTVLAPHEIPAGIVTAFIGTPYFLWLLWQATRQ